MDLMPTSPKFDLQRSDPFHLLIVGGGLAGLAAASALAPLGMRITLLESRNRLGGRASSFQDPATGQLIDTCQHVSMGCCTNLTHFCRTLGLDAHLAPQKALYFLTPDGKVSRFGADPFPVPLHLGRGFAAAHFLTPLEKIRIGWGLMCLTLAGDEDSPLVEWLLRHGQTRRTIDRFWGLVLVSALNESPDRLGLRYAKKVFRDGFLTHPRGFEIEIPTVPLGELYGPMVQTWLERHGVDVLYQRGARHFHIRDDRVAGLELRDGSTLQADAYLSTVPFDRLLDLLPEETTRRHPYFANLRELEQSPITSVHLWWDRALLKLPHVVLVDCLGQWVFPRGESAPGEHYLQVVVSAARGFKDLGRDEIQRRIVAELRALFPAARDATLLRARVITEHGATFSAVPGVDRYRPAQVSPVRNLFLAGDWTATGWPATMEGAVRSGYLAAEALLERIGVPRSFVQPDLK